MIIASLAAVEAKDLISSLIALSAAGLGLSLAFLILKAPNLAITQLVVEILCIIILIRATINKDLPLARDGRWMFNTFSALLFIACFLLFGFFALRELPAFASPLMLLSGNYFSVSSSGSANVVTEITSKFRSFDSLAEAAILFSALIGVLAITRKTGKTDEK